MKKYFLLLVTLQVFSLGQGQVIDAVISQNTLGEGITKEQSALIFSTLKTLPNGVQISMALLRNGTPQYIGVQRQNDTIFRVDNRSKVFEIGSLTKVFTAALLADVVLQKRIALTDTINNFLGFPLKDNVAITFKQLATHTSGLPRVPASLLTPASLASLNPYKEFQEAELKEYLAQDLKMAYIPGEKSEYSNLGVGLLGYLLSTLENTSYEDLLQTKIFTKYNMTTATTIRPKVANKLVLGVNDSGTVVPNWDMEVLVGAGGALASVTDLSKFAIANFDDSNAALKMTRTPFYKATETFATGLAWGIVTTDSKAEWYWHNGGTGGYTSSIILDTAAKNGVVLLSNITALGTMTNAVTSLCPELMKTIGEGE
ncbi:beta-lactamase family protein [Cellulophaga sp. F20128]|uniref:serine hydrolase domain-containing protein n=1 Tax=Cellulophaga sp. F20128 TaxID=2926413 RepID=UPI001FF31A70|nr:serine hydrolase domain-containing protein [Cellulophaga sp. F20128]MCK0155781.1 beta-lactamase family protein [Cellulophaga sp. F20128]